MYTLPELKTGDDTLDRAFRIAVGDLLGNVCEWKGALSPPRPCLLAGLHYDRPWTRDAAINAWNGLSLVWPQLARDTLEAALVNDGTLRVGGQYWDAMIWTSGAWHHYLATGDREFLATAFEATRNSLSYFEAGEFDPNDGLFRGGACFMDGISGYPDRYVNADHDSGIVGWASRHPAERHPSGEGFPAKALSTNLLYREAYRILPRMAKELGDEPDPEWTAKAARLGEAIRTRFAAKDGRLAYLVDAWGGCDRQEGLGWSFAILFELLDPAGRARLVSLSHSSAHGITALWPDFERYHRPGTHTNARHGATVWPQVNAFWTDALVRAGAREPAYRELRLLAEKADRDGHFAEVYHHETGARYGGEQEDSASGGPRTWTSEPRQSWCATGFIRMLTSAFAGMRLDEAGPTFDPWLPPDMHEVTLRGLSFRGRPLGITVRRTDGGAVVVRS